MTREKFDKGAFIIHYELYAMYVSTPPRDPPRRKFSWDFVNRFLD